MSIIGLLALFAAAAVPTALVAWAAAIAVSRPAESQAVARALFLWGAFVAAPLAFVAGRWLLGWSAGILPEAFARGAVALLVAPWMEEGLKFAGFRLRCRLVPTPAGVVSGLAVGLGFALAENFLALMEAARTGTDWGGLAVARALGPAGMHALAGVAIGLAGGRRRGLVAAAVIHGLWNAAVLTVGTGAVSLGMCCWMAAAGVVAWRCTG